MCYHVSHLSLRKSERSQTGSLLHWLFHESFTTSFLNVTSSLSAELPLALTGVFSGGWRGGEGWRKGQDSVASSIEKLPAYL